LRGANRCEGRSRFFPARTFTAKPSGSEMTARHRSVAMPSFRNDSLISAAARPSPTDAVPQPYDAVRLPVA